MLNLVLNSFHDWFSISVYPWGEILKSLGPDSKFRTWFRMTVKQLSNIFGWNDFGY
jgi:hypothetical protein